MGVQTQETHEYTTKRMFQYLAGMFLLGAFLGHLSFAIVLGPSILMLYWQTLILWYFTVNLAYWYIFLPLYLITGGLIYFSWRHNQKPKKKIGLHTYTQANY